MTEPATAPAGALHVTVEVTGGQLSEDEAKAIIANPSAEVQLVRATHIRGRRRRAEEVTLRSVSAGPAEPATKSEPLCSPDCPHHAYPDRTDIYHPPTTKSRHPGAHR